MDEYGRPVFVIPESPPICSAFIHRPCASGARGSGHASPAFQSASVFQCLTSSHPQDPLYDRGAGAQPRRVSLLLKLEARGVLT